MDLLDLEFYSELDAFKCQVGDIVITEKKSLSESKTKLTCSESIDLFILAEEFEFNRLKEYDEKELKNSKKNIARMIKKKRLY